MAVFDNLNHTFDSGVSPSVTQYYERKLLEHFKNNHVYGMDLQKRPLPPHNGRNVQFRKWVPFDPIDTPLQEGVTPTGQTLSMKEQWCTIKPYGKHIELTDEMDWALLDDAHKGAATLMAEQAADSIEVIRRNALATGTNVQYAGSGNDERSDIDATDVLTYAEIKKAVRTLKKNGAKPFADGFYHAIVDADTVHDLTSDTMWTDVAKYQDKGRVSRYELGTIYKVKFFESTMPMTFAPESYLYGTVAYLAMSALDSTNKVATIAKSALGATEADVAYGVRNLVGRVFEVGDVTSGETTTVSSVGSVMIERIVPDGTNLKLHLRWMNLDSSYTFAANDRLIPTGGGASSYKVHGTIIYGQDFAGEVALDGNGDNAQVIVKPAGSSGALDPLNQRSTIAWKVKGFCATILQDAYIVRIEHGVSA